MEMLGETGLEEEADGMDAILTKVTGGTVGKVGKVPEVCTVSEEVGEEEPAGEDERLIRGTEKLAHYIRYRMMQILSGNRSPI